MSERITASISFRVEVSLPPDTTIADMNRTAVKLALRRLQDIVEHDNVDHLVRNGIVTVDIQS